MLVLVGSVTFFRSVVSAPYGDKRVTHYDALNISNRISFTSDELSRDTIVPESGVGSLFISANF